MRRSFAIGLIMSVLLVLSAASAYASDHSPGVQHELVMQMATPYVSTQVFEVIHPDAAAVPFGAPPCESTGVLPEVEARCNSPTTFR